MPRTIPTLLTLASLGLGALSLGACKGDDKADTGGIGGQGDGGTVELTMPDLTGVDIDAAFADAIDVATTVSTGVSWAGHSRALERRHEGCPDFYVGAPEDFTEDFDLPDGGGNGMIWYDNCTTPGGLFYRGMQYWDGRGSIDGDPESSAGQTQQGNRTMAGAGTIGDEQETRFQFRGTATDSLSRVVAPDYDRWTYSSTVEATVTGTDALDPIASPTPGGWRAGLYMNATGGDSPRLEARGDVYLFDHRIQDRFDSVAIDIELLSEAAAGPDDCALEPRGWIGLRDENAWWIDVVFMPVESEDGTGDVWYDPTYSACDGCGTVYVRGVEAEPIGTICPDFQQIFDRGILTLPEIDDYVFTIRSLDESD
jgi:hypothetical protein